MCRLISKVKVHIMNDITIQEHEVEITVIRAQGVRDQNVNKVSSVVQLRFASVIFIC